MVGQIEFLRFGGRPIRALIWANFALAFWLAPVRFYAQAVGEDAAGACARKNRDYAVTVDHFLFASYSSEAGGCLEVICGGKVVFRRAAGIAENFTLGQPGEPIENIPAVANGTDVTGRGHPDMIVSLFTGGAHCCTSHLVFELEPELKLLATLTDAHDDLAHFERDRKDSGYNYITADWIFAYWPTCFACSPSERVVLRWADDGEGGGFHLALDKMREPAPTAEAWNKDLGMVHKVVSDNDINSIGQTLWQTVLDLIYTGHSDLAWKFVDAAGPKAQQKPFPTLGDFCGLLRRSQYWPELEPTLKDVPPACAATEPATKK